MSRAVVLLGWVGGSRLFHSEVAMIVARGIEACMAVWVSDYMP